MIEVLFYIFCVWIILKYLVFPYLDENKPPETEADKQHRLEREKEQRGEFIFLILLGIALLWWLSPLFS